MSSYFDALARDVHDTRSYYRNDEAGFLEAVADLEDEVIQLVSLVTGDREFPDDLRETIQNTIAVKRIRAVGGDGEGRELTATLHFSVLFEELHEHFHEVARRRIRTRFGLLDDNPAWIVKQRDEHDRPRIDYDGSGPDTLEEARGEK